jgi:hypothetical protein
MRGRARTPVGTELERMNGVVWIAVALAVRWGAAPRAPALRLARRSRSTSCHLAPRYRAERVMASRTGLVRAHSLGKDVWRTTAKTAGLAGNSTSVNR